jgi:dynein heavy chain
MITAGDPRAVSKAFETVKLQLADLINLTQTTLSKADRQRIMCMITLDAHNRDTLDVLLREKALNVTDFQWQSKLRPRFISEMGRGSTIVSNAEFCICDARYVLFHILFIFIYLLLSFYLKIVIDLIMALSIWVMDPA